MAEKSLSQLPRELRALYTKGNEALQRDNFDYAADLFAQLLMRDPAFYECRKVLRVAQQRKSGGGGSFFKKAWSSASASPLVAKGEIALRRDPAEALAVAEQILNNDANNSAAHRLVVKAATALEMPHTAVLSLEVLYRNHPKDKEIAVEFGNFLADIGEIERGERVMTEICRLYPTDPELGQVLKNISARKTMDEGGYDSLASGGGSYRDILKNKEEAVSLEQQNRVEKAEEVTDRLIKEYEDRLQSESNNLKLVRSLAELYAQKKDFERALSFYDKLKKSDLGNDASLDRAMSDTVVKKLEYQISLLDSTAPDHPDRLAQLEAEKQAFQLEQCRKRVEKFPTDLQFRFELGQLYFQAGKIGEAIQEFQKAQGNPHRHIAALNYLGQCFAKRRMYELATRTLHNALKEKLVFDDEKKDLVYNLANVLEGMGKKEEAIKQLELIYEIDVGYRDVAARVDAFYAGGQAAT